MKCTSEYNELLNDITPATDLEDCVLELADTLEEQETRAYDFILIFTPLAAGMSIQLTHLEGQLIMVYGNTLCHMQQAIVTGQQCRIANDVRCEARDMEKRIITHLNATEMSILQDTWSEAKEMEARIKSA